jgi:DNA repair ATPase RecN
MSNSKPKIDVENCSHAFLKELRKCYLSRKTRILQDIDDYEKQLDTLRQFMEAESDRWSAEYNALPVNDLDGERGNQVKQKGQECLNTVNKGLWRYMEKIEGKQEPLGEVNERLIEVGTVLMKYLVVPPAER